MYLPPNMYKSLNIHIFIYTTFMTVSSTAVCDDHLEKSKLYTKMLEELRTVWSFAYRLRFVRYPNMRGPMDFSNILHGCTQKQKEKFIWD